jgi:hypothetical protein
MLYAKNPAHFLTLMRNNIRYEYENDGHFYSDAKPTISKRDTTSAPRRPTHNARFPLVMGEVDRVYWSPPFVGDIGKRRHPELVKLVEASKAFSDILEDPKMIVTEKMDSGTCVIFDNLRIVHARNAFDLNSGRRWLKGAYLGRQDFINKASSLTNRMGPARLQYLNTGPGADSGPRIRYGRSDMDLKLGGTTLKDNLRGPVKIEYQRTGRGRDLLKYRWASSSRGTSTGSPGGHSGNSP